MRTDHISAWLIKDWLNNNVPDIAAQWPFEVADEVKMVVKKMQGIIPTAQRQATAQNVIARNAIRQWNLTDVALLAGGTPTPLSPTGDQLLYFTDGNPEAVAEARQAGYPAVTVNVTSQNDLQQLSGGKTAIATGLFHFLPDQPTRATFDYLYDLGYETIVFTHANPDAGQEILDAYAKLGVIIFIRDKQAVSTVISDKWRIVDASPVSQLAQLDHQIGSHLADLPSLFDVYRVVKN